MKSITIRVEEDVKNQAEVILNDIGMNITTLFNACLKALIREQGVPFSLSVANKNQSAIIKQKLEESLAVAADPNAKRYSHEEIFGPLREKYQYEV